MIESLVPIFGIIFTFGIPGIIIFWVIYTKHRERMRLIEKGLTPDEFKRYFKEDEVKRSPYRALRMASLLIFLGIGLLVANVLSENYNVNDGVTFGVVMIFLGIGFLVSYFLVNSKVQNAARLEQTGNSKV